MRNRPKDYVVIRASTPAERRNEAIFLVVAVAYSAVFWAANAVCLWRLMFG